VLLIVQLFFGITFLFLVRSFLLSYGTGARVYASGQRVNFALLGVDRLYMMLHVKETCQPADTMILTASEQKLSQTMSIIINEDDDDNLLVDVKLERSNIPIRRLSLPVYLSKSIMKRRTLDESLHCSYGSEDEVISGRRKKNLSLQFDKIKIREYSRTVGDNPSCSSGPPVSISWEYNIIRDINLDEYEKSRPPRRVQNEMILPRDMREDLLRCEWNASRKEITDSVRRNVKVKNQRRTTINNLDKSTKFEVVMESACRKLKRFVNRQKSVHKQVRDLEEQIDLTNRGRSKLIYLEQNMSQGEDTAPIEKASLVLSGSNDGIESS